jgi:RNA polymerase sigma-70 factor (ECF subfamily)
MRTPMGAVDETGFRDLLDRHFADVWRFALRRVGSEQDADDIAAETFGVAWRRRGQLPDGSDTRLWLFGVARNLVANHRRAETRRRRLYLRLASNRVDDVVAPSEPPAGLREAFAALSDTEREVVIMRHWDGLAVGEIATLLGCTPNAVSLRLHKARQRLAELLAEKDPTAAGNVTGDPVARKDRRHA